MFKYGLWVYHFQAVLSTAHWLLIKGMSKFILQYWEFSEEIKINTVRLK